MGTAPTTIVAEQPMLSQPQRIINTFFDPIKTFTDIRRGSAWWMAFLVTCIISWVFVAAVANKIGFEQVNENEMKLQPKQMERMEQMPPADRANAMAMAVKITKGISWGYPVFALIGIVITAGILMMVFNFALGATVTFGRAIAVVVYSGLVLALKALVTAVTLFAGANPEFFTFTNPLASNLGFFIDMNAHPALYRFCSSMDVFGIWYVVLLGLGFATVSVKVKRSTGIAAVAGLWLLWVLGATALKAF